jgi:8-oxo-dGTP pyrophosphatase MutT (NUDIX family)
VALAAGTVVAGATMGSMDAERVAVYDPDDAEGRAVGVARRDRVRRENLPHAASAVLVRRRCGEVFVHRRADTKDLWPGYHDCTVGGVVLAGEDPGDGARRELAEELGIDGAVLTPLLRRWYRDERTWVLGFVYVTEWDGEVEFADGEVAEGWWEAPQVLLGRLADPSWVFVPDTRLLLGLPVVRAALGQDGGGTWCAT